MTEDGDDPAEGARRGEDPPGDDGRAEPVGAAVRPSLSTDGAYALLWGVVALAAAALAFDGTVGAVVGLAGIAGAVGIYAAARDLLRGHPPARLEYLWTGTPALLGAGVAALEGRLLAAGGLGVVAAATLVEGYGRFDEGEENGDGGA